MNPVRNLRQLAGLLFAGTATLLATSVSQPPAGLDEADWARLRSTLDVARHRIAATAGGHQAHNPGQHWRTRFEGQGFLVQPDGADWQWGLELTAYGFPGREHTVPTGSASTSAELAETRLEYAWDAGLTEWFVNDARGLEHGFTVHERPDDRQVLECGDRSPLSLHHDWLTDAGQLHDLKEKRRPAGTVQDVDATATRPAIHYPPSTLYFHLAVRGGLRPVLEQDRRGVRFVDADGTTRTTYAGLKVWDADGRILPARFEPLDAGRPAEITLAVAERGARYPLTIDPIAQQAYLKASNTGAGDWFGRPVAISGDTAVIGALRESSNATGINADQVNDDAFISGAAYVFVRNENNWTQQAYLKASNTDQGDVFGYAVAISGDTIVVGAPSERSKATGVNGDQVDNSVPFSGAAYIFVRSGTTWTQQAYLKASNAGALDEFGSSVAISGDTVIVGAPYEGSNATGVNGNGANNGTIQSGAAYVFVREGGFWRQQAYLKASNTGIGDLFGSSVAISDNTAVAGAPGEWSNAKGVNGNQADNSFQGVGAAYVFVRDGTEWKQEAYLKASNSSPGAGFGISVAVAGNTVAIGGSSAISVAAVTHDDRTVTSAIHGGAAYVFGRNGVRWTQQAFVIASNPSLGGFFGSSVALSSNALVVGAFGQSGSSTGVNGSQETSGAANSGSAYLFRRKASKWTQRAYLKASNTGAGDYFGESAALSGNTLIVGARNEASNATGVNGNQADNTAPFAGAAYIFVFQEPSISVEQPAGVGLADRASSACFGAVSLDGSVDLTFTLRNSGTTNLTDLAITLDGPDANQFSVTANSAASVAPGESSTFTVRFNPTSEGTKTATLHIASNDPVQSPFDVTLVGTPNVPTVAARGNDLTVSFVGTPGSRYRVQYLPGLTGSWTDFAPPALYTVPASGVISHTDLNPPDTLRLYRAVLAP